MLNSTIYYDPKYRVRKIDIIAEDGQDSLLLEEIANLIKNYSVPDIKVQMIGDINES